MNAVNLNEIIPSVAVKIRPFIEEILRGHSSNIHSYHLVGSAVIPDYNEKLSDINSVVVLHNMDLKFIRFLAPLGQKYGKKKIAAPLVMTPGYMKGSLDAFPIEFLDFKLIHKTIHGSDIFNDIEIAGTHLRLQCEREVKTKLIGLRQGYISSLGKKERLSGILARSFTSSMALLRAIILLLGKEPPILRAEVVSTFGAATRVDKAVFENLLLLKAGRIKPSEQELRALFESYYNALEAIGKIIDELPS
jgi:hypothetical protein